MTIKSAIPSKGFDVNQILTPGQAAAFKAAGYDFCIRYLPRTAALIPGNLTATEIEIILAAGLNLLAVQHCPMPGWYPNSGLGTQYGNYAATYAKSIGYPPGALIYLDLETPASGCVAQDCIDYAQAWFAAVEAAGFIPGVYLGYGLPMTPQQLYDLPFKNYWRAYNGPDVATRGYQLIQKTAQTLNGISFDPNECIADELGDLPVWVTA